MIFLILSFKCPCGVDENNPDQNVYKIAKKANSKKAEEKERVVGENFILTHFTTMHSAQRKLFIEQCSRRKILVPYFLWKMKVYVYH